MARLYIDQSKSDFQTTESCVRENWFSRFLMNLFGDQDRKNCCNSKECQVKSVSMNFAPRTPKITSIGLKLDFQEKNDNTRQFWGIEDIKNFLKQYFNIQRYQRSLHILWKPDNSDERSAFSFTSFSSIITNHSEKVEEINSVMKTSESTTMHCEDERSSCKNPPEMEFPLENPSSGRNIEEQLGRIEKSKRNVSVQTSNRKKKRHRKVKESSKDIETIFKTNNPNFKKNKHRGTSTRKKSFKEVETSFGPERSTDFPESPREWNKTIKSKSLVVFRENKSMSRGRTYSSNKIDEIRNNTRKFLIGEEDFGGGGESIPPEIPSMPWQNFPMEDKASEILILGNVKKRLEKDFDDYLDEEFFQVGENSSQASFVLMTSMQRFVKNSDDKQRKAVCTNLTCTSSIRFSNLDVSQSQSSYHTSLRECSPSSSVEYCTAVNNSVETMLRDSTIKETEMSQDSREFFDQTLVNSYTLCCYQRTSTPKSENFSKRVTESMDSGIFSEHFRKVRGENWREEERIKELDLLGSCDTDSSCSDESLNRRVDVAVENITRRLILAERRARMKLRRLGDRPRDGHRKKWRRRQIKKSSPRVNDDGWISSSSSPLHSFSDSEIDHL